MSRPPWTTIEKLRRIDRCKWRLALLLIDWCGLIDSTKEICRVDNLFRSVSMLYYMEHRGEDGGKVWRIARVMLYSFTLLVQSIPFTANKIQFQIFYIRIWTYSHSHVLEILCFSDDSLPFLVYIFPSNSNLSTDYLKTTLGTSSTSAMLKTYTIEEPFFHFNVTILRFSSNPIE